MNAAKPGKAVLRNAVPANAPNKNLRTRNVPVPHEMPGKLARVIRMIVRSLIAILLLWAGLSKLADPVSAYTALLAYELPAPPVLLKLIALVLPWLELLCGLMLVANFHRRLVTLVATVLFGVFLVMVGQAAVRGLVISCGCFNLGILGIGETSAAARFLESIGFAILRNLILLGGALYLIRADSCGVTTSASGEEGR